MASVYWEAWRSLASLYEEMQGLIPELLDTRPEVMLWVNSNRSSPISELQIQETKTAFILRAHFGSIEAENLEVSLTPEVVTLTGAQRERVTIPGYCDFSYTTARFQDRIPLPERVQPETATAELRKDVLLLILPKATADSEPNYRVQCPIQVMAGSQVRINRNDKELRSIHDISIDISKKLEGGTNAHQTRFSD